MKSMKPGEIERESFRIITEELGGRPLNEEQAPIIKRVIHTTADFDYASNLEFSSGAVKNGLWALKNAPLVVTDTTMALSGISKISLEKGGGSAICYIADTDVKESALKNGTTRAAAAVEKLALELARQQPPQIQQTPSPLAQQQSQYPPLIVAVGNAPTALYKLYELYKAGRLSPSLVIGAPVGFVNVVESKELIMGCGCEYIVAKGRKGGSGVAAAIVNALLYMAFPREE